MIKKVKIFCLILIIVTTAGCVSTQTVWVKPGATQIDFNIDQAQCNVQAFSIVNASALQVAIVQNQCLIGKGWSEVVKESIRNDSSYDSSINKTSVGNASAWESCTYDFDCKKGLTCQKTNSVWTQNAGVCK